MASGFLNTAEIEEHTSAPTGCINMVPLNLTRMNSDKLNACIINKYANMLGDDNHTVAIW